MAHTLTAPAVRGRKVAEGAEPLVMVTAYDAPGAGIAEAAGVDLILVGDSVAMVVLGHDDTLQVTVSDMVHHVGAVARGLLAARTGHGSVGTRLSPMVVADMPWLSYHLGPADAVGNAAALVRAGAHAVKLEGGRKRATVVEAIVDAEIPVMGHIGLTPQSLHAMGGFKVQARRAEAARAMVDDAKALVDAGCFCIVVEGVPDAVSALVTSSVPVPTIGIGAGRHCDGQVLVFHDLVGLEGRPPPRFVRRYADLRSAAVTAVETYAGDVRSGRFPTDSESYHLSDQEAQLLGLYGARGDAGYIGQPDGGAPGS
ncbi:MAG: 3-methyl-2-oxobutanoate hydroxymethyltransferase [Actinobacteria bacterium]|nr:3-methyl-2-oxobutanoate hydroxymethyltransferase [Actinomycetota bacterium]